MAVNEIFVSWPFKSMLVSLADSCLTLVVRISADFHSQMLCGRLSPALVLGAGEFGMELRLLTPQGE